MVIYDNNININNNPIFKLEYSFINSKFRDFYLSFLNESDFHFEFGLNSIPVLKFLIGNLIMKCNLKKNFDFEDFTNFPLRGFKSFDHLISYYYGFLLDFDKGSYLREDGSNEERSRDGRLMDGGCSKDGSSKDGRSKEDHNHNSYNNNQNNILNSKFFYFCDKFLNFYLIFKNLKHSYSTPDSLLRDFYLDALYCAIDFFNLSKNNDEDEMDFINNYNFEEESSIFIVKCLLIQFKEGFCEGYEFLDKDLKKINVNEENDDEEGKIMDYEDKDQNLLHSFPLLQNDNSNNIFLLKKIFIDWE